MSKVVNNAKNQLNKAVMTAIDSLIKSGDLPSGEIREFNTEVPADKKNGDFSINVAMVNSKVFAMPPRKSAELIMNGLDLSGTYFEKCEVAGPGFMNFYLSDKYYADILLEIADEGENYGRSDFGKGEKVLVEFVSANPTGPMHMGNARGGALGVISKLSNTFLC